MVLIGADAENPYFEVNFGSAVRFAVYELERTQGRARAGAAAPRARGRARINSEQPRRSRTTRSGSWPLASGRRPDVRWRR